MSSFAITGKLTTEVIQKFEKIGIENVNTLIDKSAHDFQKKLVTEAGSTISVDMVNISVTSLKKSSLSKVGADVIKIFDKPSDDILTELVQGYKKRSEPSVWMNGKRRENAVEFLLKHEYGKNLAYVKPLSNKELPGQVHDKAADIMFETISKNKPTNHLSTVSEIGLNWSEIQAKSYDVYSLQRSLANETVDNIQKKGVEATAEEVFSWSVLKAALEKSDKAGSYDLSKEIMADAFKIINIISR